MNPLEGCPGSQMLDFIDKDRKDTEEPEEKIESWFEDTKINTLTVLLMQVPCCMGLLHLAQEALQASKRKVPVKSLVVGLKGEILHEEWV